MRLLSWIGTIHEHTCQCEKNATKMQQNASFVIDILASKWYNTPKGRLTHILPHKEEYNEACNIC